MDFEQRLSAVLHDVADADPPTQLVSRTLAALPERRRSARLFSWPLPVSPVRVVAGVAALALVALVLAVIGRPGPLPPAQDPSPTPRPSPTLNHQGTCPDAFVEGVLVRLGEDELGIETDEGENMTVHFAPPIEVDSRGGVLTLSAGGRHLAVEGDTVRLTGAADGAGWYACGVVEVIESGFITTGPDGLRTFRWDARAECPAFGVTDPVTGTLEGDPGDALEPLWLRDPTGQRLSVVWPRGFSVAFEPEAVLRNEVGEVVARPGSQVELGQVSFADAAGTYGDPYVAAGLIFSRCYPALRTPTTPPATPSPPPAETPRECPGALMEGTLVEVAPGQLGLLGTRIYWEPAYFRVVDDGGVLAVADRDGVILAREGDIVQIGGGQIDGRWYACGSLVVISSPQPTPSSSQVIDADEIRLVPREGIRLSVDC
jgi:hypothetical protein